MNPRAVAALWESEERPPQRLLRLILGRGKSQGTPAQEKFEAILLPWVSYYKELPNTDGSKGKFVKKFLIPKLAKHIEFVDPESLQVVDINSKRIETKIEQHLRDTWNKPHKVRHQTTCRRQHHTVYLNHFRAISFLSSAKRFGRPHEIALVLPPHRSFLRYIKQIKTCFH